jgi:hypothetical protein
MKKLLTVLIDWSKWLLQVVIYLPIATVSFLVIGIAAKLLFVSLLYGWNLL